MSENSNIVSKKDLGNGKKQVTFRINHADLNKYFEALDQNNIPYEVQDVKIGKGMVRSRNATVRSRYESTPYDVYSGYNSNTKPYTTALAIPTDPHKKIELAIELYHKEPIVGTVIDMMVDFSASGFVHECEDDEIKKLYDEWASEIGLHHLVELIFLEYYRSGNVYIYRNDKDIAVTKISGKFKKEYKFPSGYTILNPMNVYIEGPLMFNQEIAYLNISQDIVDMVNNGNRAVQKLVPKEVLKAVRDGSGRVMLNPELLTRITRKKQPYERYASPFLERVFEPVLYKQKLRQMDMSTIDGLINQLVTVTVGNDEYPATDDDLEAIAELFQTPNKAYTVFWNHTLKVTFHKPEGIDTLDQDKYKQVNEDILAGLGVSRVLIDGSGSNFSTAWVSILSMIERLDNTRQKVKDWLEKEYKRIAKENGLDTYPKVQFNKMSLREDGYVRDVLLPLYDRGLLDEEDVLRDIGRDYDSIVETKKRNMKNRELFLPPEQPFQGGRTSPNLGRPPGSNENGYKERESTPEQNAGNTPKPRTEARTAMAYYLGVEEDYRSELEKIYQQYAMMISNVVEKNAEQAEGNHEELLFVITGMLIDMMRKMEEVSNRYIDMVYETEVSRYADRFHFSASVYEEREKIKQWNSAYLMKLADSIKNDIAGSLRNGSDIKDLVKNVFDSKNQRIKAISQSVVTDSARQAAIMANKAIGRDSAVWVAHLDERTCGVCAGLHGKRFRIDEVPPRPHVNCRCELRFE